MLTSRRVGMDCGRVVRLTIPLKRQAAMLTPMAIDLLVDRKRLVDLCQRYHVSKLELFGSRAKGTARADSDVDLLVTFDGRTPGLAYVAMAEELEALFGRHVDLLTRSDVERDENPIRRQNILSCTEALYAA